jgi:hypothetical protein
LRVPHERVIGPGVIVGHDQDDVRRSGQGRLAE